MSSADSDSFTSFSCLITLARTSNTVLNSSGESSHPCLFLISQEKLSLQLFTVRYDVNCELIINGLYCLEVPSFHFVDRFSLFLWWKLFTWGESFLACSMLWAALFWSLLCQSNSTLVYICSFSSRFDATLFCFIALKISVILRGKGEWEVNVPICLQFSGGFFFFFWKTYFLAVVGPRCCTWAFSSCGGRELLSVVCVGLYCSGFSCCGAWVLGAQASVIVLRGLSICSLGALEHWLSSCGTWF